MRAEQFYVYELIDPRNGAVFYIGKGSRNRIDQHEREAIGGKHSRKCNLIREIMGYGYLIDKRIVQYFADEAAAYKFEADHIEAIGLDRLTNVIPGGTGAFTLPELSGPWTARDIRVHAATIAKLLRILHANLRIFLGPFDITEITRGLLKRIRSEVGAAILAPIMAQHGIEVSGGAPQG